MKKTKPVEDLFPTIKINRSRGSGKKRADLFARLRNDEHPLDGMFPVETVESATVEDYPTLPHPSVVESTVSPTKNFTKFSNSLLKQAIPEGLFRGQSKHTYDVLYLRTRGAINPVREVQLTKTELVKLTGLEIKTIQRHLSFLRETGLINVDPKIGDHKGAVYSVVIPEEITLPYPTLRQSGVVEATVVEAGANYTPHPSINYTTVGQGNPVEDKAVTENPNTSFKDIKNDDEPLRIFQENFRKISQEFLGRDLSKSDQAHWGKLSDLLILELKIAAPRTENISSVPAFLTEVLRRKLRDTPISQPSKIKIDKVGKPGSETYEIKPLNEKGREAALNELREFSSDPMLEDFKKWYTEEDWAWLTKNLK